MRRAIAMYERSIELYLGRDGICTLSVLYILEEISCFNIQGFSCILSCAMQVWILISGAILRPVSNGTR